MSDEEKLLELIALGMKLFPGGIPASALHRLSQEAGRDPRLELPFSGLEKPIVMGVSTTTVGAFLVPIFQDKGQTFVVIQERNEAFQYRGRGPYGLPGGFVDLDASEQPAQGAAREVAEETIKDGKPVLIIKPEEFVPLVNVIDYDYRDGAPRSAATSVFVFVAVIEKYQAMQLENIQVEEVDGYTIMPLSKARDIPENKFTHSFTHGVIQRAYEVDQGKGLSALIATHKAERGR